MRTIQIMWLCLATCLFTACEKTILTDDERPSAPSSANLNLSVYELEQISFSSLVRTSSASEVCTRLNFAVYDQDGSRLKQINQKIGDNDFGSASFELPEGDYQLVALAHSSNTNPTMTNPAKIQFSNSQGYSETFLHFATVTIGGEPQNLALSLRRIVSLCRFVINDDIPDGIVRLEFTYKGGSGHFDAKTGLGVTNSTQVAKFDVQPGTSQTQYDLYTFLHDAEGTIHLKVAAYDVTDVPQYEREFDIPMGQNKITWIAGDFFTGISPTVSQSMSSFVTIDNTWDGEQHLTY